MVRVIVVDEELASSGGRNELSFIFEHGESAAWIAARNGPQSVPITPHWPRIVHLQRAAAHKNF
jgi:hypothetical protein